MKITPAAAPGSLFQALNPDLPGLPEFVAGQAVSTALSPDGRTLLILTSGYNRMNGSTGSRRADWSNEYVFVYDVSGPPSRGATPPKSLRFSTARCCLYRPRPPPRIRAMAGQSFEREDELSTDAFNLALWVGLRGEDVPYPRFIVRS